MPKPEWKRARNRERETKRLAEHPWRRLYFTGRWRRLRAQQLATQPMCERCLGRGILTPATVCHHLVPHKGNEHLFWTGPFASSCANCHDSDEKRIEGGGKARPLVGEDGWPVEG